MNLDLAAANETSSDAPVEVGTGMSTANAGAEAGRAAAAQATAGIRRHAPSLVLVFVSSGHDLAAVLRGVRAITGDAPLVGATTGGEILGREHHGSVVVAVLASPFLRAHVGAAAGVSAGWEAALDRALAAPGVARYFDRHARAWIELGASGRDAFAILLSPGNTRHAVSRSFDLLEALKRRSLGRLRVFGGSSGDDWGMEANFVLAGDEVIRDGLAIAVVETELRYGIALAHGFRAEGRPMVVTEAQGHEVLSLDGRPAADAYADLLGLTREALRGKHLALDTGRVVGSLDLLGHIVPNVASWITPRGGVLFTRAPSPGTELYALSSDEQGGGTALEAVRKASVRGGISEPAVAVLASCALRARALGLTAEGELGRLGREMPGLPVVGFASFGEQGPSDDGVVQHTNAVVGALVLGRELSPAARAARENERLRRDAEQRAAELARVHDGLERIVADRTRELVDANRALRVQIEERSRAEAAAQRHLRALRTLTSCNEALVRATSEPSLLGEVCRTVVDVGGYRMCWVGLAEHDERRSVRAVAQRGFDDGYLDGLDVVWADVERGRGPVGTAIRTGRPIVVPDVLADPGFAPWRDRARTRGFRSMAAVPLVADDAALGALAIYAADVDAFADAGELRLLVDLAGDLAYGLGALRARGERAELAARMMQTDRLAAVGTLAAGVAHEVNNPLAYVVAGVEFARERLAGLAAPSPDRDELAQVLDEVREGAARIRQIVNDLRTFSRADEAHVSDVRLAQVLDVAAKLTATEIRHRARVVREYRAAPPVRANEGRLVQVFVNLLINAAHAIPRGDAERNEIRLVVGTDDHGRALAEVHDTGAGIDARVMERMFEPFFTTKPIGLGTGLGLSICRNIVLAAGGEISASSTPGRGTCFRVALPPAGAPATP